jgi:hypothetical protein
MVIPHMHISTRIVALKTLASLKTDADELFLAIDGVLRGIKKRTLHVAFPD